MEILARGVEGARGGSGTHRDERLYAVGDNHAEHLHPHGERQRRDCVHAVDEDVADRGEVPEAKVHEPENGRVLWRRLAVLGPGSLAFALLLGLDVPGGECCLGGIAPCGYVELPYHEKDG